MGLIARPYQVDHRRRSFMYGHYPYRLKLDNTIPHRAASVKWKMKYFERGYPLRTIGAPALYKGSKYRAKRKKFT